MSAVEIVATGVPAELFAPPASWAGKDADRTKGVHLTAAARVAWWKRVREVKS